MAKKKLGKFSHDQFIEIGEKIAVPVSRQKRYSNKLIAFLDILGITHLIETHKNGNEHEAINRFENIRKIVADSTNVIRKTDAINYVQISDSFVFVCTPEVVDKLIELLSRVQMRILVECQLLLRGAITIGDAIEEEDGKYIIGPAFIQAYRLQENDAVYPRIIVDKSVVKVLSKPNNKTAKYLCQDSDKEYFIDYIRVMMNTEGLSGQDLRTRFQREGVYDNIQDNYDKNYHTEQHNIWQKYGWTIQYYTQLGVWKK